MKRRHRAVNSPRKKARVEAGPGLFDRLPLDAVREISRHLDAGGHLALRHSCRTALAAVKAAAPCPLVLHRLRHDLAWCSTAYRLHADDRACFWRIAVGHLLRSQLFYPLVDVLAWAQFATIGRCVHDHAAPTFWWLKVATPGAVYFDIQLYFHCCRQPVHWELRVHERVGHTARLTLRTADQARKLAHYLALVYTSPPGCQDLYAHVFGVH